MTKLSSDSECFNRDRNRGGSFSISCVQKTLESFCAVPEIAWRWPKGQQTAHMFQTGTCVKIQQRCSFATFHDLIVSCYVKQLQQVIREESLIFSSFFLSTVYPLTSKSTRSCLGVANGSAAGLSIIEQHAQGVP